MTASSRGARSKNGKRLGVVLALSAHAYAFLIVRDAAAQDQVAAPQNQTPPPSPSSPSASEHHHALFGDDRYRSPGLAAALSLTPVPVDFGNLYAENVPWGIAYSTGEIVLGGAMMWLGGGHMCRDSSGCGGWSTKERNTMIGFAAGYVGLKLVAAIHAASAARGFNDEHAHAWGPVVVPSQGGVAFGWVATF